MESECPAPAERRKLSTKRELGFLLYILSEHYYKLLAFSLTLRNSEIKCLELESRDASGCIANMPMYTEDPPVTTDPLLSGTVSPSPLLSFSPLLVLMA